jgi:hypothetical protein
VAAQGTVQDILEEEKEGNNETAGHQPVITDKFQQPIYGYIHGMFYGDATGLKTRLLPVEKSGVAGAAMAFGAIDKAGYGHGLAFLQGTNDVPPKNS